METGFISSLIYRMKFTFYHGKRYDMIKKMGVDGMEKEKEYCEYLKGKIEECEKEFVEAKHELYDFYGGCTDSCEIEVEWAWNRMKE